MSPASSKVEETPLTKWMMVLASGFILAAGGWAWTMNGHVSAIAATITAMNQRMDEYITRSDGRHNSHDERVAVIEHGLGDVRTRLGIIEARTIFRVEPTTR